MVSLSQIGVDIGVDYETRLFTCAEDPELRLTVTLEGPRFGIDVDVQGGRVQLQCGMRSLFGMADASLQWDDMVEFLERNMVDTQKPSPTS